MVEEKYLLLTSNGFSEEGYGTFDSHTMTAVLTRPCDRVIRIESDNITLTSTGRMLDNTTHTGIYISNVMNITIQKMDLKNQKIGIYCNGTENITITDVNFEGCIYGMSIEYCSGTKVEDCNFYNIRQCGISGNGNWDISLKNNYFERMKQGIGLDGCNDISIVNSVMRNCRRTSILISNARNVWVYKNSIKYGKEGIVVKNCEEEVGIKSNHISDLKECGIYIYKINKFQIENNRIQKIQLYGMVINIGTVGILENNRIIGSDIGVSLECFSEGNIIRKNHIVDCRFKCIEEYSDSNEIERNNTLEYA